MRYPNTGSDGGSSALKFYDFEKKEEKLVMDGAGYYLISADKSKILVEKEGNMLS